MKKIWQRGIIIFSTLLIVGYSLAHSTCSGLVEQAIESVASACNGLNRNQVCYGNVALDAIPVSDAPAFIFEQVGDITDVAYLRRLKLAPLDEVQGVWGM